MVRSFTRMGFNDVRVHRVLIGGERLVVLTLPAWLAPPHLTRAERAIANRLARGETNAQIAVARRTSPRTVANQISALYRKVGVTSRAELVVRLRGP